MKVRRSITFDHLSKILDMDDVVCDCCNAAIDIFEYIKDITVSFTNFDENDGSDIYLIIKCAISNIDHDTLARNYCDWIEWLESKQNTPGDLSNKYNCIVLTYGS